MERKIGLNEHISQALVFPITVVEVELHYGIIFDQSLSRRTPYVVN
jgi:hypothetical protein